MSASLRCPYCHDTFHHEAPSTVCCVGCGAAHHLDCFVECSGCAVFACRTTSASHNGDVLGLEALDREIHAAEGSGSSASLRDYWVVMVTLGLVVAGVWAGALAYGLWGSLAGGALGIAISWLISRVVPVHERSPYGEVELLEREMQMRHDPHGVAGLPGLSSTELLRMIHDRLLRHGPRREPGACPQGLPPETCPRCAGDLTDDSAAAGLWHCYHCGAELVDSEIHWLRAKERE